MSNSSHVDEVRRIYANERARRLRDEGNAQYEKIDPSLDPWAEPVERSPLRDQVDVAVIGAGLSGLVAAVELRRAGIERIRLIDRAGDVGGTWYWNRYPAAQCDVESYIYMPLLEEMGYIPTMKYVYQPEILAHCQALARSFDLYRDACFQTGVQQLTWDDVDGLWSISTDRGDAMRARYVVIAGGILQLPKFPAIPGLSDFRGKVFHSSRWDYSYTGGHPGRDGGGLPNLRDKAVGVIGTGATGLQIATPLADAARHLYVFQRTPTAVLPRNNMPTDPEWLKTLKPGWQAERMEFFHRRGSGILGEQDLVEDEWTRVVAPVLAAHQAALFGGPEERAQAELVDMEAMDAVRQRVTATVRDPKTAAALMPFYVMPCKRPSFHDEFLETFNRPNVTLVDTAGQGPEKITGTGVVVAGQEYEVDCLILATGFFSASGIVASWEVEIVGRDGMPLSEYWGMGMRTFHGVHVHNFPNLFIDSVIQTAGTINFTSNVVELAQYIAYVIGEAQARKCARVEPTTEAEDAWVEELTAAEPDSHVEFYQACTPGFYNNEGHLENVGRLGPSFLLGRSVEFYEAIRKWREQGTFEGLQLT
jgi:cation diffusion facilitator CzcD-associated flavoprotein CzcO